jgi:hypothetical protein
MLTGKNIAIAGSVGAIVLATFAIANSQATKEIYTTQMGLGASTIDNNYRITTEGGGIKAVSSSKPAGYFNSTGSYGLLVDGGNAGFGTLSPAHKISVNGSYYSIRKGTGASVDWNAGNLQSMTLVSGNTALSFSNGQDGGRYTLLLQQPASGSAGTVSWPSNVRWGSSGSPSLTAQNGKADYVSFIYQCHTGTCYYDGVAFNAGF